MVVISDLEWRSVDGYFDADYETVWRLTMIQALLVGQEIASLPWHRLERYHDCLHLAGPRLWARLLVRLSAELSLWDGDIGDLFRLYAEHDSPTVDGWNSGLILTNPFVTPIGGKRFTELVRKFVAVENLTLHQRSGFAVNC